MPLRSPRQKRMLWQISALRATLAGIAALALLTGPGGPSLAGAAPAAAGPPPVAARTHTVTLLTGDVVRVADVGDGKQLVEVQRPRDAVGGARAMTIGKHVYVLPDEVLPYLAADRLDRRLFDVTGLIEQGYDDQHSDGIPLIVSYAPAPRTARSVPSATPDGTTHVRTLPSINGAALRASKKRVRDVWQSVAPPTPAVAPALGDGLAKIWLDGKVRAHLAESTAQIGAPAAWAAGYDGSGVKVAVLDTGVDQAHPDLAGRVSLAVSFVPGEGTADVNGHGTHVASTVGGSGAASGGVEKGVAPGANLIVGKVLSDSGFGEDSWVIAGMEWAAAQGAKVISMSLGDDRPSDGTDPMSLAVDQLTAQTGALFVIAAGNTGAEAAMGAPGTANSALTVGAVDSTDQLAWFSTKGPRYGDYGMKPDITAPGVGITAAHAGGTDYVPMDGTSMATPHVAGAAAILAQQHPQWTSLQLKDALMSTSKPLGGLTAYEVGAGRVDVAASMAATVTATGSAYFGLQSWPHASMTPIDRTVTYTNTGDVDVTLNLTETAAITGGPYDVDPWADAGTPAPDGMFTLSAPSVTVPAHGTATVTANAVPGLGADGRRYLGQIVATDGGGTVRARTQVGMYVEDERHNLHVTVKDRAGHPAAAFVALQMLAGDGFPFFVAVDETGEATVRLRGAAYSATTYLDVAGSNGPDSVGKALLGEPELVLDRDRALVLDARKAREVTAVVPRKTEDRVLYMDWYRDDGKGGVLGDQFMLPAKFDSMFVLPTRQVTIGSFEYETRWRKEYPRLTVTDRGRPVTVYGQAGSSFYNGKGQLDAVYAGTGTPAEYAGRNVRGKVVLVTRSDEISASARAQAAADAGAKLLIVVNDGPGKLFEWVGPDTFDGYSAVPVVTVTARVGAPLVAEARRGKLRLALEGVPNSPYAYDLVDPHPGRVPTNLTYKPRAADLSTVDMRFFGRQTTPSGEFRWDYRPYRPSSLGTWHRVDMPGTRTDYVSAQPGTAWAESAVTGPGLAVVSVGQVHAFQPGKKTTVDFFGPVVRPRDGGGFIPSERYDGFLVFNMQPWSDGGAGHAGYLTYGSDTLTMKVYAGGELVKVSEGFAQASIWPVPAETINYTVDLEASRDPAVYPLSPRTHTVWQVVSLPVASPDDIDGMPVLQLDYRVDADLAGNVRGGRQSVGLLASHLPGVRGGGRVVETTLEVSFDDGATWRAATLTPAAGGGWTASFDAPSQGYVSLRATARDDAGNSISQEVIRAYGLR